ncbi:MAG: SH3 domain-containing protein [Chloroflexota bacterium]
MPPKYLIKVAIFLLLLSACGVENHPLPSQTATVASPTRLPSSTYLPSLTPPLPTSTITPEPVSGITLWQLNVRSGPGIYYTLLGQINQNQSIQIVGVDASLEWFAIKYTSGPEGIGWVTSEYIQASGADQLPIIGQITLPNGTPAPQANLTQKLNVRSGPGTHYDSLGILPVNAIVWLTGRNESGSWLQIDFPTASSGKGWIIAGYVKAQDIQSLPALDSSGTPLAELLTTQATMPISTPTPTIAPAFQDEDSAQKPGTSQVFSPLGIRNFSYTSDLSTPEGDLVDWIAIRLNSFQPGTQITLYTSLKCTGNGTLQVQLWQEKQQLTNWDSLTCGDTNKILKLTDGSSYLFRLNINAASELRYVLYTFSIFRNP